MTRERPDAVVLIDAENLFHPYGRNPAGLEEHKREVIEVAHPHIAVESALRLAASVAVDIVDWIDRRYVRAVSRSFAKARDPSTKSTYEVLRGRGFTLESVPDGADRADYALVGRLFLRLSQTQDDAAYIIGSADRGVLGAVVHARREVQKARQRDGLPGAQFSAITRRLRPAERATFDQDREYGSLRLTELPDVIATARIERRGDVEKIRAHRAVVTRALAGGLRAAAEKESAQRAFATAAIAVAAVEADGPSPADLDDWRRRVQREFDDAGASADFSDVVLAALTAADPDHIDPEDPPTAVDRVSFVLRVSFGLLDTAAAGLLRDPVLHSLVASTPPPVMREFLRLVQETLPNG